MIAVTATAGGVMACDAGPQVEQFRREVLAGLRRPRKTLPCKYFYDAPGSALFDRICELPEYYQTRTETRLLRDYGGEMARLIGPGSQLIEYGSGSSLKTRVLLDALDATNLRPAAYIPVDISREHLRAAAAKLSAAYAGLDVRAVCADYTQPFELPRPRGRVRRTVAFFPGSTIGNFEPVEAREFLRSVAITVGPGGGLLIGVDLKKDPAVLHAAYNDSAGVTAAFNLNLLGRMNAELGADFDLGAFHHYAFYNPVLGRVEMHLVSARAQEVRLGEAAIEFAGGESIHTENSYKYTGREFTKLAGACGFEVEQSWVDAGGLFSVHMLRVAGT